MKNLQKGFILNLLVAIITILIVGGGAYVYLNKKAPSVVPILEQNDSLSSSSTVSTSTVEVAAKIKVATSTIVKKVIDVINCGTDLQCFINAANECKSASVISANPPKLFGPLLFAFSPGHATTSYQVLGRNNEDCRIKAKILGFEINFSQSGIDSLMNKGFTLTGVKNLEVEEASLYVGMSRVCTYNINGGIPKSLFFKQATSTQVDCDGPKCVYSSGLICVDPSATSTPGSIDKSSYTI